MPTNVLILCTHNSARSVLAEGMLNHWARRLSRDVRAYSAGSAPSGRLNPFAVEALANAGVDVAGYHSKSWNAFVADGAPHMRIVITVCDNAHEELGVTGHLHWSIPDPVRVGTDDAFDTAYDELERRITELAPRLAAT